MKVQRTEVLKLTVLPDTINWKDYLQIIFKNLTSKFIIINLFNEKATI